MAAVVAVILACALLGSIPAAFIVTKIALGKDIRSVGSGNPGATNVFRALGLKFAVPVFLFDFLKGFLPVLWILRGGFHFAIPATYLALLAGTAAIAGHMFSPFIGWKGGKGVATGSGVVSALYPLLFPACLAVFLPVFLVTRKMSLASICSASAVPVLYILLSFATRERVDWILFVFFLVISAIVVVRHARNIRRILNGTEERLF